MPRACVWRKVVVGHWTESEVHDRLRRLDARGPRMHDWQAENFCRFGTHAQVAVTRATRSRPR